MTDIGAPTCPKHPKEITYVRCAKCNVPICPRCSVQTAVGMKCRDCGTHQNTELFRPSLPQVLAAAGVGLVGGALAGGLFGSIGFFGIWLALIYGRFLGTLILRASGQKMGLLMDSVTVVSILVGGLAVRAAFIVFKLRLLRHARLPGLERAWPAYLAYVEPYTLIILIIVAAVAVSRLRWSWNYWGM